MGGNPNLQTISGFQQLVTVDRIAITQVSELTEVSAFANLRKVNTIHIYQNDKLNSIVGLNKLESCNLIAITNNKNLQEIKGMDGELQIGDISISSNRSLKNINAFNHLKKCNNITINNNKIRKISGFNGYTDTIQSIDISANSGLDTIEAFNNVAYIKRLSFAHDSSLKYLSGFKGLKSSERIVIGYNKSLKQIGAFESLDTIYNDLNITYNDSLINLTGFQNLKFVKGVYISSNTLLKQISNTFCNANTGLNSLRIAGNSALSACSSPFICNIVNKQATSGGVPYTILNNKVGCNTYQEIKALCVITNAFDENLESEVKVWPNPATTFFQVSNPFSKSLELKIETQLGKVLLEIPTIINYDIDISSLKPGLFILTLTADDFLYKVKLIKE